MVLTLEYTDNISMTNGEKQDSKSQNRDYVISKNRLFYGISKNHLCCVISKNHLSYGKSKNRFKLCYK